MDKEIQITDHLLQEVINFLPDATLAIDTDKKVIVWNKAIEEMTGVKSVDILGKGNYEYTIPFYGERRPSLMDIILDNDLSVVGKYKDFQREGEKIKAYAFCNALKGGKGAYVLAIVSLLHNEKGEIIGAIESIRDITEIKNLEKDLRSLNEKQEALMGAIPDIVMEVDNNKIYTWANKAGLEFFGNDVLGKEAANYFEGEQKVYDIVEPLFKGSEDVIYVESWQKRKDGEKRLLAWWCHNLKDEKGDNAGAISSARDITDIRKSQEDLKTQSLKLNEAKAKDEALLASIGDGVIATNSNEKGKIIFMNKKAEEMLGLKQGEATGGIIYDLIKVTDDHSQVVTPEKRPITFALQGNSTITTTAFGPSYYYQRKDGTKFPVAITCTPISLNNKVIGAVEVFRDISREKEVDKEKSEFVSLASHQLRTPITTLNWYSEMLLNEEVGELNAQQERYVKEIYQGNKRMIDLVNALLTVSRIGLGTFAIEPKLMDIKKVAEEVCQEMKAQIREKRLLVRRNIDDNLPEIESDPTLVHIVLQNLLCNAVDYSPEGGTVDCSITKNDAGGVLVEIKDQGCGIPISDQGKIFDKFYRAGNAHKFKPDGNGLGLYITKSIVDNLGGTISLVSDENKGTTFTVTLPGRGVLRRESDKKLI